MELTDHQDVFVVLNSHGYIADSSESCGVCDSLEEAKEAVEYLKECCDGEEFTIVEAELTLKIKTPGKDIMEQLIEKARKCKPKFGIAS